MLIRLLGLVTKNPMVLLWIAAGAFLAGAVSGGGAAWKVQGWRLESVQARFDGFVATTKAEGEAAQKLADAQRKADQKLKERTDAENKSALAALRTDNQRLRNARALSHYVPAAASGAGNPERACFERAELERAIQRLDDRVSGVVDKGSEAVVKLDSAKTWATSTQPMTP